MNISATPEIRSIGGIRFIKKSIKEVVMKEGVNIFHLKLKSIIKIVNRIDKKIIN